MKIDDALASGIPLEIGSRVASGYVLKAGAFMASGGLMEIDEAVASGNTVGDRPYNGERRLDWRSVKGW